LNPDEQQQALAALKFLDGLRRAHHGFINPSLGSSAEPLQPVDSGEAETKVAWSESSLPSRIGKYEIIRSLGRGGFAEVFLAFDPDLEREVALKIPLIVGATDPMALQRFQREARAAALLSHPAIVPVFEVGSIGAVDYIAFEYCPGSTLAQFLVESKDCLDHRTTAAIVAALAGAVQHAHERGIIHRDLKPSNVLLETRPEQLSRPLSARVRITDFGLAFRTASNDRSLTLDGTAIGTPAYMSPEQAIGNSEPTCSSDIYALGMILYEMLTGNLPFRRSSHLATLKAVEAEDPPSLRSIVPSLSSDLEAICLKCLAKDPTERYAAAADLQEDLNRWLQGMPVTAKRAGRVQRTWRWVRRHQLITVLAGGMFLSLLIGLCLTAWQWRIAQAHLLQMERQRQRAELHLSNIERSVDAVLSDLPLHATDSARMSAQQRLTLERMVDLQQQLIAVETSNQRLVGKAVSSQLKMAVVFRRLGQFPQALEQIELVEKSIRTIPKSSDQYLGIQRILAESQIERAVISYQRGEYQVTLYRLDDASKIIEQLRSTGLATALAPLEIRCLRNQGMANERLLNFPAAQQGYEAAAALAQHAALPQTDNQPAIRNSSHQADIEFEWALSLNSLAVLYSRISRFDDSHASYQLAKKILAGLIQANPLHHQFRGLAVTVDFNLGNAAFRRSDWNEARNLYGTAAEAVRELVSNDPGDLANIQREADIMGALGLTEAKLREWESAKAHFHHAMELTEKLADRVDGIQVRLRAANNLARLLAEDLQQIEEAESVYLLVIEEAGAASQRFPQEIYLNRSLAIALGGLGKIHLDREDYESARRLFEQQRDCLLRALEKSPQDRELQQSLMFAHRDLSLHYRQQGQLNEATRALVDIAAAPPQSADMAYRSARELFRMYLETEHFDANQNSVSESDWKGWRQSVLDHCYQQLELAIERKLLRLSMLDQEDPIWEPLRSTDRFQRLLKSAQ
jgi:tetratricopeptide (TPR) repeat protein